MAWSKVIWKSPVAELPNLIVMCSKIKITRGSSQKQVRSAPTRVLAHHVFYRQLVDWYRPAWLWRQSQTVVNYIIYHLVELEDWPQRSIMSASQVGAISCPLPITNSISNSNFPPSSKVNKKVNKNVNSADIWRFQKASNKL